MLKLFMTGDNHIGLKYASHEQAAALRLARLTAFEPMVDAANQEHCGLFVITGDLFENTYGISKREIKSLLEILSRFEGTVAILPGNHDYYEKNSKLWQPFQELLAQTDNILLLNEERPYHLTVNGDAVILYPALCTSIHSAPGENNLDWIKAESITPDSTYRIGIAHGAVEGETIDQEGRYFLMSREELEAIPMDAWLIGHTHVPFPRDLTETFTVRGRIFNAGTHVQTDVACHSEGQCFLLELNDQKQVRARIFRSGNLQFHRVHISVSAGSLDASLHRELDRLPDNSVVELILSGAVSSEEYETRVDLLDRLLSRFLEGSYQDSALSKLISRDLIEAEFPETSFSAALLTALLEEPKEAQLAYELLKALKEGK